MVETTSLSAVALRRRGLIHLEPGQANMPGIERFLQDLASLGFVLEPEEIQWLPYASPDSMWQFMLTARALTGQTGADYRTFYPDFARQVPLMSDADLFINATIHYLSVAAGGNWQPDNVGPLVQHLRGRTLRTLRLARKEDLAQLCEQLLGSSQPFSETDAADLRALESYCVAPVPVPIKENLALVVASDFAGHDWSQQLKTTTDVLRVASQLSGGDRTLATNSRFRLARRDRRRIVTLLERVLEGGNFDRHLSDMHHDRERWKRLLHCLHVQEFPQASKVQLVRQMIHETELPGTPVPPPSRQQLIDDLVRSSNIATLLPLLTQEPGDFARRLHSLVRMLPQHRDALVAAFHKVSPQVSARVLVQMWNFFHSAPESVMPYRLVLTKRGGRQGKFIRNTLAGQYSDIIAAIEAGLAGRHSGLEISLPEDAHNVAVPLGVRSASPGSRVLGRGTRLPITGAPWIRLFLHWRNIDQFRVDLDLSALFANSNGTMISRVAYTNLRNEKLGAYHSGDLTTAPEGAAEYIDIDVAKCLAAGCRYVVLTCFSYSRARFGQIPEAYIGVMTREDPFSGAHFESSEVLIRSDLTGDNLAATPAVIDLESGHLLWVDWTVPVRDHALVNIEASVSELEILIQHAQGSRHMSIAKFLALTGATITPTASTVLDPMQFDAVSALIDC